MDQISQRCSHALNSSRGEKMRLTPLEPEVPHVGGFTNENDIFNYRSFGERLANLVRNIDEPLVIVLDGPWGSGKSTFVKQWAGLLRENKAPVIELNAFEADYYQDAFIALSASIHAAAKEILGGSDNTARRFLNKAKKVGNVLSPIALRVAARASTAGVLSLEEIEAGGEAMKAAVQALGNESAKAVERVLSERIRNAAEERAALYAYREVLSELAKKMSEQRGGRDGQFPLVFIIDELDRCRPPFALSVIERVKHLFSVFGVRFILVTYLHHLEETIRGSYGTTFDAHSYLEKFYHLRVTLPEPDDAHRRSRKIYIDFLWASLNLRLANRELDEVVKRMIYVLSEIHNLSLRQIERSLTHVALVCAAAGENYLVIAPLVAGLCVMRQINPILYDQAKSKSLSWRDSHTFLTSAKTNFARNLARDERHNRVLHWWRFATGEDMGQDDVRSYNELLMRYDIDNRTDIIQWMTQYIDELAQRA
jgi:energy-coupling factor transporter ATP-binding protein EcfA2